jgi:transcriptional regulator with XRE-family HTH domain
MKSPVTGKEMVLLKETRTLSFRKEEFGVVYHYYKCKDSKESFTTTELDELNLNQLYNQYRVKHKLPFPDEIKLIREKYGLSAAKMSEVLGFGANMYRNYEGGEVPNQSNARLIQLADDAGEFKKLVELSSAFVGKALERVLQNVESIIQDQKLIKFQTQLADYFLGTRLPDSNTGYRLPNLEKISEMVVYFTEKMKPWKTKLNKLLFYADFVMYNKTGFSISGTQYRAITMGPAPNNFQSIFEYLANNDHIDVIYTTFADGNTGEQFVPNAKRQFNPKLFKDQELIILDEITERFKNTSTNEMIKISHKEKAWIENKKESKIIDYKYSFDLI